MRRGRGCPLTTNHGRSFATIACLLADLRKPVITVCMIGAPPERIEAGPVVLRAPTIDDAPDMFRYSSDPEVCRYLAWAPHKELGDALQYISDRISEREAGTRWTYAITIKPDNQMIGHIRLTRSESGIGFGYALASDLAGLGIMTRALKALVEAAQHLSQRLWAYCDTENVASVKVLEKCGFDSVERRNAWQVFPNLSSKPRDCYIFERIRPL